MYSPGEYVKGNVILRTDKEIKVRNVRLNIAGRESTSITVSHGKHSHTYREYYTIFEINDLLFGEGVLPPGEHRSDFSFRIPENAPPSYNGFNTKVTYLIKAQADVPLWFDVKTQRTFLVLWNPNLIRYMSKPAAFATKNYFEASQRVEKPRGILGLNKPRPSFSVELDGNTYLAGENIKGRIIVKNPTNKTIRKIKVLLRAKEYATALGHTRYLTVEKFKDRIDYEQITEGSLSSFTIPIPRKSRTTFTGMLSRLDWFLEMQLDIAFAFDVKSSQMISIYQFK